MSTGPTCARPLSPPLNLLRLGSDVTGGHTSTWSGAFRHFRAWGVLPHCRSVRLSGASLCAMAHMDNKLQLPSVRSWSGNSFHPAGVFSTGLARMSCLLTALERRVAGRVGFFYYSRA